MPARAKRLTSQYTRQTHPCSAYRTVFFDRSNRIFRTRRFKAARRREKGRHECLINAQKIQYQKLHQYDFATVRRNSFARELRKLTRIEHLILFVLISVIRGQIFFPDLRHDLPKFSQRHFELSTQNASPCVQHPVVFCGDGIKFCTA